MRSARVADSLVSAVVLMVFLTVLQRGTGFFRNVLVCRLLDSDDLGCWNLSHSVLLLLAPLIVLGLPGTFKRYLAYYRERGQLHLFVRRATVVTGILTLVGVYLALGFRHFLGWAVFGASSRTDLIAPVIVALIFVIVFNFCAELLMALRQAKVVFYVQFANSVLFTVFSLVLILAFQMRTNGVIAGFAAANFVTSIWAIIVIRQTLCGEIPDIPQEDQPLRFWHKLAPFAAWYWIADLCGNLFGFVDRLMIVHLADKYGYDGLFMIGQYHSSQVIGMLLVGLTSMFGGVLLSYLSHDWETGNRDKAERTLDFATKLAALALTATAGVALLMAPPVFQLVLDNKFTAGFRVLPLTMAYCIWFGLLVISHNFLWCREKPWLVSVSFVFGLLANVSLNLVCLPLWGLDGAVAATAVANLLALGVVFWLCHQLGMRYSLGTLIAVCAPASLVLGGTVTIAFVVFVAITGWSGRWLFSDFERAQLLKMCHVGLAKLRIPWLNSGVETAATK